MPWQYLPFVIRTWILRCWACAVPQFHGARQSLTNHSPEHWVRTAARSKFPRFFGLCIRGSEHSASAHVSQSVRYNTRQ